MKQSEKLKEEYQKALAKEEQQRQLKVKRDELTHDANGFREMARDEARLGNVDKARFYETLAQESQTEADKIILDGEQQKQPVDTFTPSEHFGKGSDTRKSLVWRFLLVVIIIASLFFCSQEIQALGDQISISVGAELVHFGITVIEWWLMWFVIDSFLLLNYRAIYDFLNTHEYPQFDFVSRCLDGNAPEVFTLLLLFLKGFSFALLFLHSPVTNAG